MHRELFVETIKQFDCRLLLELLRGDFYGRLYGLEEDPKVLLVWVPHVPFLEDEFVDRFIEGSPFTDDEFYDKYHSLH